MYEFYQQRLFHPLGITRGLVEFDATGHFVGGAYGYMPARDWARLGQLYLQEGRWQGRALLPAEWVAFATRPSPVSEKYGAQIWLNTGGNRWPRVPHDAYAMVGHQGQRVVVIPSRQLVLVRTGVTEDRELQQQVMAELLEGVLAALPEPAS